MDVCQPRKSSWRRGYVGKDVQDEFMDSGPPRARRVSQGSAWKHPEAPRHEGCPGAAHGSTLRQGGMPAWWPQGSWGQAGSACKLVPGIRLHGRAGLRPQAATSAVPRYPSSLWFTPASPPSTAVRRSSSLQVAPRPPPPTHTCHTGARPPDLSPSDTRTPLLGGHSRPCPSVTGGRRKEALP